MASKSKSVDAGGVVDPAQQAAEDLIDSFEVDEILEAEAEEVIEVDEPTEVETTETAEERTEAENEDVIEALNDLGDDDIAGLDLDDLVQPNDDDVEAATRDLAVEEAKEKYYADSEPDPEPTETKPAKKAKGPKAPRLPRSAESLPSEMFLLDERASESEADDAKKDMLANMPKQKKVIDKVHNLLTAVHAGRRPSNYTWRCFEALTAKDDGEITSKELVTVLTESGYSIGTARSQAGQVMSLFPFLEIAERKGGALFLNPHSTLVPKMKALGAKREEKDAE